MSEQDNLFGKNLRFEVFKDKSDNYRWRLKALNNKIIADSAEGYINKQDCLNAIQIIVSQAFSAEIQEL